MRNVMFKESLACVHPGWRTVVQEFFNSENGRKLEEFLDFERENGKQIYPADPFRALKFSGPEEVRVLILGQDPYHGEGQANGFAFSVNHGVRLPPSLRNIYKEISREYPRACFDSGDLTHWSRQGVLLLNSVLTVESEKAASHAGKGWERLTDLLIAKLAGEKHPTVFMLWGNYARKKRSLVEAARGEHLILESNHPSPLSATKGPIPFIGNGHFKKANDWLQGLGAGGIEWWNSQQQTLNFL